MPSQRPAKACHPERGPPQRAESKDQRLFLEIEAIQSAIEVFQLPGWPKVHRAFRSRSLSPRWNASDNAS
jgi:hypothetical protein